MITQQIVVVNSIDKSLQINSKSVNTPFTLSFVSLPQIHEKAIFGHSYSVKEGITKSKTLNCLPF